VTGTMNRANLRYCLQKLLTMSMEKKITIIAVISVVVTITLFWLDDDPPYENIFKTIFELLLMTILIFGIITMNFFAISFFVKGSKACFDGQVNCTYLRHREYLPSIIRPIDATPVGHCGTIASSERREPGIARQAAGFYRRRSL
jgi:hypothetical protein